MSRFGRIRNVKSRRKYSDVFDALKEEIVGGKYRVGSVFPSHAMIARRFGISNLTAVKVVEKLKDAGLVCSQQGRGTFVTPHQHGCVWRNVRSRVFARRAGSDGQVIEDASQIKCREIGNFQFRDIRRSKVM